MVFAVSLGGKRRKIFGIPDDTTVWDIAADGRLLFSHEKMVVALMVASPSSAPERDVSAMGYGVNASLSADGKEIVFSEVGPSAGADYSVWSRRMDGTAAVEIGEGGALGISPDGKFVVALVPSQPTRLRVLPTGAGEARTFDVAPVNVDLELVSWMPGNKEFVFLGHEGGGPPHAYRVAVEGGPARPLTNQTGAHFWNRVSPDGKFVIEGPGSERSDWQVKWEVVDLETGQARPVALLAGDQPLQWEPDDKHVFVAHVGDNQGTIFRVDVFSGQREVWKQLRPGRTRRLPVYGALLCDALRKCIRLHNEPRNFFVVHLLKMMG